MSYPSRFLAELRQNSTRSVASAIRRSSSATINLAGHLARVGSMAPIASEPAVILLTPLPTPWEGLILKSVVWMTLR